MDLLRVEKELKKRLNFPYVWGRKQSDSWDLETNFIYKTYSVRVLLNKTESFSNEQRNYAMNRWYNFWSAKAIEFIFCSHKNVIANKNVYDKLVDFNINQISFDHKTSVFPSGYERTGKTIEYAEKKPKDLAIWLYENQSQEQRKHLKNRLFIVLHNSNKKHWQLKAEIMWLKKNIDNYMEQFDEQKLLNLNLEGKEIQTDILFAKK